MDYSRISLVNVESSGLRRTVRWERCRAA